MKHTRHIVNMYNGRANPTQVNPGDVDIAFVPVRSRSSDVGFQLFASSPAPRDRPLTRRPTSSAEERGAKHLCAI